jgi:hypothetical protein
MRSFVDKYEVQAENKELEVEDMRSFDIKYEVGAQARDRGCER